MNRREFLAAVVGVGVAMVVPPAAIAPAVLPAIESVPLGPVAVTGLLRVSEELLADSTVEMGAYIDAHYPEWKETLSGEWADDAEEEL